MCLWNQGKQKSEGFYLWKVLGNKKGDNKNRKHFKDSIHTKG